MQDVIGSEVKNISVHVVDQMPGGQKAAYQNGVIYLKPDDRDAIEALLNGVVNERNLLAFHALVHEMMHAKAEQSGISQNAVLPYNFHNYMESSMEVMNEICARGIIDSIAKKFKIDISGLDYAKTGYQSRVRVLERVIDALGANKGDVFQAIRSAKAHSDTALAGILAAHSKLTEQEANYVVMNMYGSYSQWQEDKKVASVFGRKKENNGGYVLGGRGGFGSPWDRQSDKKLAREEIKQAMLNQYGSDFPNATKPYNEDIALRIARKAAKRK